MSWQLWVIAACLALGVVGIVVRALNPPYENEQRYFNAQAARAKARRRSRAQLARRARRIRRGRSR